MGAPAMPIQAEGTTMTKSVSEVVRAGMVKVWVEAEPGWKLEPESVARGALQPSSLHAKATIGQ